MHDWMVAFFFFESVGFWKFLVPPLSPLYTLMNSYAARIIASDLTIMFPLLVDTFDTY